MPRHWRAGNASWRASISKVSLCVLPHHALLGFAPAVRCGCHAFGRWCACVGWRVVGGALMLTRCGCTAAVWMCGWDAAGNGIGDTGAVALAKALESGQCQLKSLNLGCESMCLAASCAAGLRACFSLRLPCFRSVVCVRGLEGGGRRVDADPLRVYCCCLDVRLGSARQRHRPHRCSGARQGTRERAMPAGEPRSRR